MTLGKTTVPEHGPPFPNRVIDRNPRRKGPRYENAGRIPGRGKWKARRDCPGNNPSPRSHVADSRSLCGNRVVGWCRAQRRPTTTPEIGGSSLRSTTPYREEPSSAMKTLSRMHADGRTDLPASLSLDIGGLLGCPLQNRCGRSTSGPRSAFREAVGIGFGGEIGRSDSRAKPGRSAWVPRDSRIRPDSVGKDLGSRADGRGTSKCRR